MHCSFNKNSRSLLIHRTIGQFLPEPRFEPTTLGYKYDKSPRLWVWIPALAGSVHNWGETLEQGTDPPTAPRAPQRRLPTAPSVNSTWVKCRAQISLLIMQSSDCWTQSVCIEVSSGSSGLAKEGCERQLTKNVTNIDLKSPFQYAYLI